LLDIPYTASHLANEKRNEVRARVGPRRVLGVRGGTDERIDSSGSIQHRPHTQAHRLAVTNIEL